MKIAIAGASGFVGQLLLRRLAPEYSLIALGRSAPASPPAELTKELAPIEWRRCDLFSQLQTERALEGADVAIYLVHSMLPTARLMQSTFENADLLLADHFARAARKAGVGRILYLGGLIPDAPHLSRHLMSRLEVESALASQSTPVTTLRAGLILGAQGSSFQMLYLLVRRLPWMICPAWTRSLTQCISDQDVVELLRFCLLTPATAGQTYDIGGPDVLSYRELMAAVAREMGLHRRFVQVQFFPGLSRLWVQLVTGASRNLISPLIESLRHEMIVRDPRLLALYGKPLMGLQAALNKALTGIRPSLRSTTASRVSGLREKRDVRSIQRLPLPAGRDAQWVAGEYFRWLPRFLSPWIRVEERELGQWSFRFALMKAPLLLLRHSAGRSTPDRQLFYITGGMLALREQPENSRIEFHEVLSGRFVIAAIHDFRPALPWPVYKYTQAVVHLWVMRRFGRFLRVRG